MEKRSDSRKQHGESNDRDGSAEIAFIFEVKLVFLAFSTGITPTAVALPLHWVLLAFQRATGRLFGSPSSTFAGTRTRSCLGRCRILTVHVNRLRLGSGVDSPVPLDISPRAPKVPHPMLGKARADAVRVRIAPKEAQGTEFVVARLGDGVIERSGVQADERKGRREEGVGRGLERHVVVALGEVEILLRTDISGPELQRLSFVQSRSLTCGTPLPTSCIHPKFHIAIAEKRVVAAL